MAALGALAAVASLAGTAISAMGTIAAGKAQQKAANYEAQSLDISAKEERAAAQQDAMEYRRRRDLAISAIQAQAAGSGFTASDPTVVGLASDAAEYGEYQAQMAQFGGDSRARGLNDQAAGRRYEGAIAKTSAMYSAAGTILGGVSSMFDRFGPSPAGRYG